ncbi:acetylcholine receptor subunit beta-type acr-3-like [Dreissena polymorpha]|uniref:acetylcholine receptor subunit beta-type acr-3-like n=1 Tax=Dreissena polymorpha TaxID=45954 RepID=UPI002263CC73|nr:acetylcholine receptor subunit beta-type acr-3-like [Dreissena polymorpha]
MYKLVPLYSYYSVFGIQRWFEHYPYQLWVSGLSPCLSTYLVSDLVLGVLSPGPALSLGLGSGSVRLNGIIEFDEVSGALKTAGYLVLSWTDEYLQWDSTAFNGTESMFLVLQSTCDVDIQYFPVNLQTCSLVLTARSYYNEDVTLYQKSENIYLDAYAPNSMWDIQSTAASIKHAYGGSVSSGSTTSHPKHDGAPYRLWILGSVLQSTCDVDIQYFPFDVQTCSLVLSAWSYYKSDVTLHQNSENIHLNEYTPNSISTAARAVNTEESEVVFEIKLKRKPGFYIINIIVAVILLSILNTFVFVLPITSGERASFSVTVFLSLAVFLTIVAASLPTNSDSVSLLSVFLILRTASSTLIVALCLLEARLATRSTTDRPIGNGFWAAYN